MIKKRILTCAVASVAVALSVKAYGDTGSWNLTTGGEWTTSANWTAAFPNGAGQTATINTDIGSPQVITLASNVSIGSLVIADSTTAFSGFTVTSTGAVSNSLTFDSGSVGVEATFRKGASATNNTASEVLSLNTVLASSLAVTASNGISGGTLRMHGPISGPGGLRITGAATGAATLPLGTVIIGAPGATAVNSFTGPVLLENGNLQFSGDAKVGVAGGLGNSSSAIVIGSLASSTVATSTMTLQVNATGLTAGNEISRGLDFSGANSNTGTGILNLRYQADATVAGNRTNTLTISGTTTIAARRGMNVTAQRAGMTVNFTGLITGVGNPTNVTTGNSVIRLGGFPANAGSELGGPAIYRFANQNNDFSANLFIVNGTVVIAGNVGANGTNSPIGRGGTANNGGFSLADGNGSNIIDTAGLSSGRGVFLETPGTSYGVLNGGTQRAMDPSGASSITNTNSYGDGTFGAINVPNLYRFGGLNTTGEVIFNNNFNMQRLSVGGFKKTIETAHNMALIAASGGVTTFTGSIGQTAGTNSVAGAPGTTSFSSSFRLTINGARNHPDLDLNGNGTADFGGTPGTNANDLIGTPTTGTVRLTNTVSGYSPTGTTEILGGTLVFNGIHGIDGAGTNAIGGNIIVAAGATLAGTGTIRAGKVGSTVEVSGTINTGDSAVGSTTPVSIMTINKPVNFLTGSSFTVDVNGGIANTASPTDPRYDRLTLGTTSGLSINNSSTLNVNLGYLPEIGTVHTIVSNTGTTPITGTFSGLAQNAIVDKTFSGQFVRFGVSYIAGDGNDLAITPVVSTSNYSLAGNGTWASTANWVSTPAGAVYPNGPGMTAVLGSGTSGPTVVALDSEANVSGLQFNNTNSYTVSGAGSLKLRRALAGGAATLSAVSGDHTIAVPVNYNSNTTVSTAVNSSITFLGGSTVTAGAVTTNIAGEIFVAGGSNNLGVVSGTGALSVAAGTLDVTRTRVSTLSVTGGTLKVATGGALSTTNSLDITLGAGGGFLDITDGGLVNYAGDLTAIRGAVASWYNGGALNGKGLGSTSSSLAAFTTLAVFPNTAGSAAFYDTWTGVPLFIDSVLVRYTYVGDTDIDGDLDGTDLANLLEGASVGYTGWQHGDFNYDGVVNGADFSLFSAAFAANLPTLPGGPTSGDGASGGSIPEPSGAALALAVPALIATRRRRTAAPRA